MTEISNEWKNITAQYDSICIECNEKITKFSVILWKKGTGVKHVSCGITQQKDNKHSIISDPKNWKDTKKYSYTELQKITECQCCGVDVSDKSNSYINCDRKVCVKCFQL